MDFIRNLISYDTCAMCTHTQTRKPLKRKFFLSFLYIYWPSSVVILSFCFIKYSCCTLFLVSMKNPRNNNNFFPVRAKRGRKSCLVCCLLGNNRKCALILYSLYFCRPFCLHIQLSQQNSTKLIYRGARASSIYDLDSFCRKFFLFNRVLDQSK